MNDQRRANRHADGRLYDITEQEHEDGYSPGPERLVLEDATHLLKFEDFDFGNWPSCPWPRYPATLELDRQLEIVKSGKAGLVQEFLDWLTDQEIGLWRRRDEMGRAIEYHPNPEQLMADFFGIDRNLIEQERRAVLRWVRSQDG